MSRAPASPDSLPARRWLPAMLLVGAVALAHWNTLTAPFVFDDLSAVATNTTIRQFSTALQPPTDGSTATGRPLLNLTYALNYALGQQDVRGYHLFNLLIHAAAALTLFGLVCRTLVAPVLAAPLRAQAQALALLVALLWAVHPLQTETVASVAQRTESLCGLFYLLTLYCFARGWLAWSVVACLAGMASKEVMATAPLLVLLYDRTFVAGTFAAAWRARRGYYLALAATWLLLGWLTFAGGGTRGLAAGLGLGLSWWDYLLTQCRALLLYLKLSVWPHPLVVDYGTDVVQRWQEVWWQGLVVLALLGGTAWALVRRPVLGFIGAWFFVILAPSSSFIPLVSQTIAEHRMYLPLAALVALAVSAAFSARLAPRAVLAGGLLLALAAGFATHRHNRLYLDEQALWEDVLRHYPRNARVLNNLGRVHFRADRIEESLRYYRESMALDPKNPHPPYNIGLSYMKTERLPEAAAAFGEALRIMPAYMEAHLNLGIVLTMLGRAQEALAHFEAAIAIEPARAESYFEYGVALQKLGRYADAADRYAQAAHLDPAHAQARSNWGVVLFQQKAVAAAIEQFDAALRLDPALPEVHFNLALALGSQQRWPEARTHLMDAVRLRPDFTAARELLRQLDARR